MHLRIRRDIKRFDNAKEEIRCLNLGGTAIGTGLNADVQYFHRVVKNMSTLNRGRTGAVL